MYTMYIFLRNKVIILKSLKKIYVLQNIKYHYPTDRNCPYNIDYKAKSEKMKTFLEHNQFGYNSIHLKSAQ